MNEINEDKKDLPIVEIPKQEKISFDLSKLKKVPPLLKVDIYESSDSSDCEDPQIIEIPKIEFDETKFLKMKTREDYIKEKSKPKRKSKNTVMMVEHEEEKEDEEEKEKEGPCKINVKSDFWKYISTVGWKDVSDGLGSVETYKRKVSRSLSEEDKEKCRIYLNEYMTDLRNEFTKRGEYKVEDLTEEKRRAFLSHLVSKGEIQYSFLITDGPIVMLYLLDTEDYCDFYQLFE